MTTVDIVMRTKDRPVFVRRALADILAQTFADWTLIIVNDGGDLAELEAVVAEFPDLGERVRYVDLPASSGRGASVMPGVDAGDSPLVNWHDDDDTWHPEFLARTVEHLQNSDDIAVDVRTDIVWERLDGDHFVETGREIFHPVMPQTLYFDMLRFNHCVPISKLYRRSAHDLIGPTDSRLRSVVDWEFNQRLMLAGEVGFIDEVLAHWHQRPGVSGVAGNSVNAERGSHYIFDRRVRDELLRSYVAAHGAGDLLHTSTFLGERFGEVESRLTGIEQRYAEILGELNRPF